MIDNQSTEHFEFSIVNVETAATSIREPDENLNHAILYLEKWKTTPDSIFQACEVLKESKNTNAHFFASLVLDDNIQYQWPQISYENRIHIRDFISQQIFNYNDNILLASSLSRALAHIAVYDFPNEWEGYDTYLFPESENNVTFLLLEAFFNDFENSKFITENRRQQLRNALISKVDFFLPRIHAALSNPILGDKAISTYNAMIKWMPISGIRIEFIDVIFKRFLVDLNTTQIAVECLKKIFLQRIDSLEIFHHFKVVIFEALSTSTFSSIPSVFRFVVSLLHKYIGIIEKIVISSNDPNAQQGFIAIITTILSAREQIPKKFWLLWYDIFNRLTDDFLCDMSKPISSMDLYMPVFHMIIQNLYEILPLSVDEDGILMNQAEKCFAKLIEVDFESVRLFLESQASSSSLCYAVGCLMSIRAPMQDMISFIPIVEILFQNCNLNIESFTIALLYGFSRSASFLATLGHLCQYLEIIINCLQSSSEKLCNAASTALLYNAQKDIRLFNSDEIRNIILRLIQMSEFFITSLSNDNAVRIFECLLIFIANMNDETKLQDLFQPVVSILMNNSSEKAVRTSLHVISKLADEKTTICNNEISDSSQDFDFFSDDEDMENRVDYHYGKYFGPFVIRPVFQLANIIIPFSHSNINDIELVLSSLSELIGCYDNFELAEQPIRSVFQLFLDRHEILPCFFTFITSLRHKYHEMNLLYQEVMTFFVYPIIPADASFVPQDAPLAEILEMIASFKEAPKDIEWIVKVTIGHGIVRYEREVNEAAAKALIRAFKEVNQEFSLRLLFSEIGVSVFSAIFAALADSMHKQSSIALIKVIYKMCLLAMNGREFPIELKELILKALQIVFQNNGQNSFVELINLIESVISMPIINFQMLENGVANFLIMQQKYSPGDAVEFNICKKPCYYLE